MILSLGGHERNPVMVPVAGNLFLHFLPKGLVLFIAGTTARWAEGRIPESGLMMLLVIIGWYSVVILNNTSVLVSLCGEASPHPLCPVFVE